MAALGTFSFYKNIIFPAQAEYSYFLPILGWKYSYEYLRFRMYWGINYKVLVCWSVYHLKTIQMYYMYRLSNYH